MNCQYCGKENCENPEECKKDCEEFIKIFKEKRKQYRLSIETICHMIHKNPAIKCLMSNGFEQDARQLCRFYAHKDLLDFGDVNWTRIYKVIDEELKK